VIDVQTLTFGDMFNKKLCNTKLVKQLSLGCKYNRKITGEIIGIHLMNINVHKTKSKFMDNVDLKNAKIKIIDE
jgi:hypothetical protein